MPLEFFSAYISLVLGEVTLTATILFEHMHGQVSPGTVLGEL